MIMRNNNGLEFFSLSQRRYTRYDQQVIEFKSLYYTLLVSSTDRWDENHCQYNLYTRTRYGFFINCIRIQIYD